jgi:hypothetical protein
VTYPTAAALNAREDLLQLAGHYETIAALNPSDLPPAGGKGVAPAIPEGLQEVLDADEIGRLLNQVDRFAQWWMNTLKDAVEGAAAPSLTPARLRLLADHTAALTGYENSLVVLDFTDELRTLLGHARRLTTRGNHHIKTGHACRTKGCTGQLVSTLGDRQDGSLACDRCGGFVPLATWVKWPAVRVQYVTPEHAARILGCTVANVWQMAKRGCWARIGTGRDTRYNLDDVRSAA